MWSLETWGLERTLRGHEGRIWALVVNGGRLISSSEHGTVLVWSIETWGCVQTVEAYPAGSCQCIRSLAVCGSALVGGSVGGSASEEGEVRVWDLETLRPLHTLRQPAGPGRGRMWIRWCGTGGRCGKRLVRMWWCGGCRPAGHDGRRGVNWRLGRLGGQVGGGLISAIP